VSAEAEAVNLASSDTEGGVSRKLSGRHYRHANKITKPLCREKQSGFCLIFSSKGIVAPQHYPLKLPCESEDG